MRDALLLVIRLYVQLSLCVGRLLGCWLLCFTVYLDHKHGLGLLPESCLIHK